MSDFWEEAQATAIVLPHRTRKAVYARGNEWNATPREKFIREIKNNRRISIKNRVDRENLILLATIIQEIDW